MTAMDPLAAVASLVLAVSTMRLLPSYRRPVAQGRYLTIDGLRGYLALFVFIHHSSIWYSYSRTGQWTLPDSHILVHMAQTSVAMFFMITGFLFFGKLLDGREQPVDWARLYVSRIVRLTPLYLCSIVALLAIVGALSGWQLREAPSRVGLEIARWLSFTALGNPDINGVGMTWVIDAGVTWSLPYEWFFYFSLPVLALLLGRRVTVGLAAVSAVTLAGTLVIKRPLGIHMASFLGGIAAAVLARSAVFRRLAALPLASVLVVVLAASAVLLYPTFYSPVPWALFSAAFILIACGNTVFGILEWRVSRDLGDCSYSLYLLHGILLFLAFRFAIGAQASELAPSEHRAVVACVTITLVVISWLTFRWIEAPAMARTTPLLRWYRSRIAARGGAGTALQAELGRNAE